MQCAADVLPPWQVKAQLPLWQALPRSPPAGSVLNTQGTDAVQCISSCHTCCALQAVYTALKETEQRATDVLPLWRVPALAQFLPRQRKALDAVALIRRTTEELIAKCKEMVDAEEQVSSLWTKLAWVDTTPSCPSLAMPACCQVQGDGGRIGASQLQVAVKPACRTLDPGMQLQIL